MYDFSCSFVHCSSRFQQGCNRPPSSSTTSAPVAAPSCITARRRKMRPGRGAFVLLLLLFVQQHATEGHGDAFVRVEGTRFMINGKPFFLNGLNAYWFMHMATNHVHRGKVSSALSQAAGAGLTVARTWAFHDGNGSSDALQYSPGLYREKTFQGLDFALSEARQHGIKMILSLVNYYNDYGGRKQYVDWARDQGQTIPSDDGFYTNPVVRGFYKKHIKAVLTRVNTFTSVAYKNDPTIMAWELMNEPRCESNKSTCPTIIQSWITEMAAHVKTIDSNHLLEAGLEGFYGLSPPPSRRSVNPLGYDMMGTDFIANNQVPGIDFATVHSYADQWLRSMDAQSQLRFLGTWHDAHIADTQAVLRKPLLVTEFGLSRKDTSNSVGPRDTVFATVYDKVYNSASTGGPAAGALFWQLMMEGMDSYWDGYEVVLRKAPSTARVIKTQSQRMNALARAFVSSRKIQHQQGGN